MWQKGLDIVRATGLSNKHRSCANQLSRDIYIFKTGRIVGLPETLPVTVRQTCERIMLGIDPIVPTGEPL